MAGVSSGIEPVFSTSYVRRRKCSSPTDTVDYIDKVGEKYTEFTVVHPMFKKWVIQTEFNIPPHVNDVQGYIEKYWSVETWEEAFKASPWYGATASELNWKRRISIQSIIQLYTTHAISSTLNLPADTTEKEISEIYKEAWKSELKGITVYRDGCREGILNTTKDKQRQAVKRPKTLEADFYLVKSKGKPYIVLVGLLDNKPYEIFTFEPNASINIKSHKGIISKEGKGKYSYDSEFIHIDDLELSTDNIEEKACTLYTSMLLRHGANINFIIKTAKKVNDNISSFSSAMCRVLAKYSNQEELLGEVCPDCGSSLIRRHGCVECSVCSWSKCL